MATTPIHHGRVCPTDGTEIRRAQAEVFARPTPIPCLGRGSLATEDDRQRVYGERAAWIGLPLDVVERHRPRPSIATCGAPSVSPPP